LASVLLGSACSSDDDNASSGASSFIAAYCDMLMPCCVEAGLGANSSNCQQFLSAFSIGYTYNAAQGDACLEAMRAASSQPDFCSGGSSAGDSTACNSVFSSSSTGTKAPGEACEDDQDCAPSSKGEVDCHYTWTMTENGSSETRTCMVLMDGSEGSAPCVGTVEGNTTWYSGSSDGPPPAEGYLCDMAKGLYCSSSTTACTKLAAIGEDCFQAECVGGAYCDYSSGKCAAQVPAGGDCTSYDSCVDTAYCAESNQCVARLPNGSACETSESCLSQSCVNKKCEGSGDLGMTMLCGN